MSTPLLSGFRIFRTTRLIVKLRQQGVSGNDRVYNKKIIFDRRREFGSVWGKKCFIRSSRVFWAFFYPPLFCRMFIFNIRKRIRIWILRLWKCDFLEESLCANFVAIDRRTSNVIGICLSFIKYNLWNIYVNYFEFVNKKSFCKFYFYSNVWWL